MKILYTPESISYIFSIIEKTEKNILIHMGINTMGKIFNKLYNIIKNLLEKNINVIYNLDKKLSYNVYCFLHRNLSNYPNFTLSTRTKNNIDYIKYINIDNKLLLIGSVYFSDNLLKYNNLMILFDISDTTDKKYIDMIKPTKPTCNRYVYITHPVVLNICDDFIRFIKSASRKVVIIMPFIHTGLVDLEIITVLKNLYQLIDVTIIQPKNTSSILFNILNKFEILFGKYKLNTKNQIKIIHTNKHFNFKIIIVDDLNILISTGDINSINKLFYNINIKLYNKKALVKEIYTNIGSIIEENNKILTINNWL